MLERQSLLSRMRPDRVWKPTIAIYGTEEIQRRQITGGGLRLLKRVAAVGLELQGLVALAALWASSTGPRAAVFHGHLNY